MTKWIKDLYAATKAQWEAEGANPAGYAIFFSPVRVKPRLAIIGYNPGGDGALFEKYAGGPPPVHEYTMQNFRLAAQMRKIFAAAGMMQELEESVKFNIIFYRSRRAAELKNKTLIRFSEVRTLEIIERIQPEVILTEGFATFHRLVALLHGQVVRRHYHGSRCFFLHGQAGKITLLGILHPTGAIGISDAMLVETGKLMKQYMAQ